VTGKATLKVIVDIFMTVSLLLLMAYSLIGTDWHEYIGIFMFVLFVVHHFLNRSWSRNVLRGRYSAFRIVQMVLVVLILLCMISSMVSGIILSRHVFTALGIHKGKALARTIHMLAGYWNFLLMSIHLGLHWNQLKIMAEKFIPIKNRVKMVIGYLPVLISGYGVFAFFKRGIPKYLTLKIQFAFFDFDEPMVFFFADYIAVMILFVWAGYLIGKVNVRRKDQ
jgi:hypothetical protein